MYLTSGGHARDCVALRITFECVDDRGVRDEVDTVLGYRRKDPFAVSMSFLNGEDNPVWTFSRDLLMRGVLAPTGDGDVHVTPDVSHTGRAMVRIELRSPDGYLVMLARSTDIIDFLNRTAAVVTPGNESEHFDVDTLISHVLAS